jgi:hypothetical protein
MSFPPKPPQPTSLLGYHRILSPTAAIRVSPLCLGAMNFGTAWSPFMGECTKATTFAILDTFHQQGGNFIDTANMYQFGESERWIGEWMAERGNRDEIVLATKFGSPTRYGEAMGSNFAGNSRKNLRLAVAGSLERLGTGYVDLLWVHAWDFTASVEEVMVWFFLLFGRKDQLTWLCRMLCINWLLMGRYFTLELATLQPGWLSSAMNVSLPRRSWR